MVSEFDVQYVARDHTLAPINNITHIGGRLSTGDQWQLSINEAIKSIKSGRFTFTLNRDNSSPEQLVVEDHPHYGPLLKSVLDGRHMGALTTMPGKIPNPY